MFPTTSSANRTPTGFYDADDLGDVSPFDDLCIIKMLEFDPNPRDEVPGHLYFGTVDYQDGATRMRSQTPDDPVNWEMITADGFFSEFGGEAVNTPDSGPVPLFNGNFYIWSAAVMQREVKSFVETLDDPNQGSGFEDSTLYIGTFNISALSTASRAPVRCSSRPTASISNV